MDIAYLVLLVVLLLLTFKLFSSWFIRIVLLLILLIGGWFLWFDVARSQVPEEYKYVPALDTFHEWVNVTMNGTPGEAGEGQTTAEKQAGIKDKIINKFTELVEINDDGTRNVDEDLAEKVKKINLPGFLQDDIDGMEGSVGAARALEQDLMDQLGQ